MRGDNQANFFGLVIRNLAEGFLHPRHGGFDETRMVVEDPQLIDSGRAGSCFGLRGSNVFTILAAA